MKCLLILSIVLLSSVPAFAQIDVDNLEYRYCCTEEQLDIPLDEEEYSVLKALYKGAPEAAEGTIYPYVLKSIYFNCSSVDELKNLIQDKALFFNLIKKNMKEYIWDQDRINDLVPDSVFFYKERDEYVEFRNNNPLVGVYYGIVPPVSRVGFNQDKSMAAVAVGGIDCNYLWIFKKNENGLWEKEEYVSDPTFGCVGWGAHNRENFECRQTRERKEKGPSKEKQRRDQVPTE